MRADKNNHVKKKKKLFARSVKDMRVDENKNDLLNWTELPKSAINSQTSRFVEFEGNRVVQDYERICHSIVSRKKKANNIVHTLSLKK